MTRRPKRTASDSAIFERLEPRWLLSASPKITLDPFLAKELKKGEEEGIDAVLFSGTPAAPTTAPAGTIEAANFDTNISYNGGYVFIPPDNSAAAGPNHVVNVVNTLIQWYTKAGVNQYTNRLGSPTGGFFSSLSPTTTTFDPKVIYDTYNNRFVVITLEKVDNGNTTSSVSRALIAVSQTSDPNGGWYFTSVSTRVKYGAGKGTQTWLDYPGIAVDANAIYLTGNMFGFTATGSFQGSRVFIISKAGFYTGGSPTSVNSYDASSLSGIGTGSNGAFTLQPAVMKGATPGSTGTFLVSSQWVSGVDDYLSVIRVDNPLASPTFTNTWINLGDIHNGTVAYPSTVPQKGTTYGLDGGDGRVYSVVWRNNALYAVWDTNPTSAYDSANAGQLTAHWVKISTTNLAALTLVDQGDVGGEDLGAGTWTFYPAIAVNGSGDIAIGFSAAGSNLYAGAYYTGHLATDAAGTVGSTATLAAGLDYYVRTFGATYGSERNRWGDYSAITVDPADDTTFWVYNQYASTRGTATGTEDGRWATRYGKFSFAVTGSVAGAVFRDNNGNGILNGGEPGLTGVTVYVDLNNNVAYDVGEPTAISAAGGAFTIAGVAAGTWNLREQVPAGFVATNAPLSVTVTSGATTNSANLGNFATSYSDSAAAVIYTVSLDSVTHNIKIVSGASTYSIAAALLGSAPLTFTLTGANAVLAVDFTNGSPLPSGGVNYTGNGTQELRVTGQTSAQSFTMTDSQIGPTGGPAIHYNGIATMTLSTATIYYTGALATLQNLNIMANTFFYWG